MKSIFEQQKKTSDFSKKSPADKIIAGRRRKQRKLKQEKEQRIAEENPFLEKIPQDLKKFLEKKYRLKIITFNSKTFKHKGRAPHGYFWGGGAFCSELGLNEVVFQSKGGQDWELIFWHELAHFIDSKFEREKKLSRLENEAVAEMIKYMIFGDGDISAAEKAARKDYKEKRDSWAVDYFIDPRGESSVQDLFGSVNEKQLRQYHGAIDWNKVKSRVGEIYKSNLMAQIFEKYFGYKLEIT